MQIPKRRGEKNNLADFDPHITRQQYDKYQAELDRLLKISRPRAMAEVAELAKLGDFSENAAYQIAKGRLRGINQRILELQEILKLAIIIEVAKADGRVRLGSTITVETNGQTKTFQIVGSQETDPAHGRISQHSPIGLALLGAKVGQSVTININDKEIEYKIVSIK